MDPNLERQPPNRRLWLAIGAVVVFTALAIWLVPDDQPPPAPIEPPIQPPAAPRPEPEPGPEPDHEVAPGPEAADEPAPAGQPAASVPAPRPQGPEGSLARTWLAEHSQAAEDPQALFEQARRFEKEGALGDAWLLYFKAARRGSAAAAMILAEQADPAYRDPARSLYDAPDLIQAHKWYRLAARNGSAEAPARLAALEAELARRARAGDEKAALLLEEWKKK